MIEMRIFNSNGAAMERAASDYSGIHVLDVYEPDRLNAETARANFADTDIKHVYIGTELALNKEKADIAYINVARKHYSKTESAVPIVDKNKAADGDGNGGLVMKNAFRHIALQEPEMFILESGIKIHPVAEEAFSCIPGYYIIKVTTNDVASCGIPQKKKKSFLIGTKRPFDLKDYREEPRRLKDILERGVDYDELPNYAKNRLERGSKSSHPAVILDPDMTLLTPNLTAHLAKDDSTVLVKDGAGLRPLTTTEIGRIQGYDDDFNWVGSKRQIIRQQTDSVGVGVARWILESAVLHYFNDCYASHGMVAV